MTGMRSLFVLALLGAPAVAAVGGGQAPEIADQRMQVEDLAHAASEQFSKVLAGDAPRLAQAEVAQSAPTAERTDDPLAPVWGWLEESSKRYHDVLITELKQDNGWAVVVQRGPDDVPQVRYGGGGELTRMVCGYLACDSSLFDTVLAALPRVMVVNMREGPGAQWLTSSIRFSISEAAGQRAGAGTVLAKLSELMFVEAIRRHIESLPPEQTGWLAGLRDRFVGKTLAMIHSKPAHPWTVEELAGAVGLSRSALADRFTALVGQPPMQYLTRWRLQLAANLLRAGTRNVASVAADVGYDSEAAFSRAFKRELGVAPAVWRRSSSRPQSAHR